MSSAVSVTKIRHQQANTSNTASTSLSSVTVRSGKTSTFTPLATYLERVSQLEEERATLPSIEILSRSEDSNELPPGTKIITHPMINNARAGESTKVISRK